MYTKVVNLFWQIYNLLNFNLTYEESIIILKEKGSTWVSMKCVKFFKTFYQNKSMLYSCIINILENFRVHSYTTKYKRSDLDIFMSFR